MTMQGNGQQDERITGDHKTEPHPTQERVAEPRANLPLQPDLSWSTGTRPGVGAHTGVEAHIGADANAGAVAKVGSAAKPGDHAKIGNAAKSGGNAKVGNAVTPGRNANVGNDADAAANVGSRPLPSSSVQAPHDRIQHAPLVAEGKRITGPVMLDVVGTTLSRDDARRIAHPLTGGVILFARNFTDRAQLTTLTEQIRLVRDDVLIAVDQEGGRVQRFKTDGFTVLPSMRDIGALWDKDVFLGTQAATAAGFVLASELRACGIDLSFTPVLDLDYGQSQAIGSRAFHRDPRVVAMLAKDLTHGLALAGMANCGKHFPGHGFVEADSHLAMPVDDRPLDELLADARPYSWMGIALTAVMPAHVIYPQVDLLPAGFSRKWVTEILRQRLGFAGAILSDDLSMHGARAVGDHVAAANAALDAGCDMVLVCNQPHEADKVLQGLVYEPSRLSQRRLKRLRPRGKPLSWKKMVRQEEYRAAREFLATHLGAPR